jgi:hypothetical protein
MGALNRDRLCASPPAGESPVAPLVPGLLTATETDAAMPTNLRGDNLVMQQLPRRLGSFPPISTGENQSRTP